MVWPFGDQAETLEELGKRYHLSRERMHQIEMNVLGQLSSINAKKQLIDFYDDFKG